jgi:cytochrome P450
MRRGPGSTLPGPRLPVALQTYAAWRWPLGFVERCRARYGPRFVVHVLNMDPLVYLTDLADARAVFAAPADVLHPGEGAAPILPIVGPTSLMVKEGDEHLRGRRQVTPAFREQIVRSHADMVAELVEAEVASWPRDTVVPLHPRLRRLTLGVVLRHIFGAGREREIGLLRERILAALDVTATTLLTQHPLRRIPPWRGIWRQFLRDQGDVDELLRHLIAEAKDHGHGRDTVLAALRSGAGTDGAPMSPEEERDFVMSVILAGHETTASELAWAFQLLAHAPAVAERLTSEIDGHAGDDYLGATVHEVLRHRPVVPFAVPRAVKREIRIGGWTYRPPQQLLVSTYLIHHDPETYADPQAFRPERFVDQPPPSDAWLPWGGGRRRCAGRHLALLELKTVLRVALAHVSVQPASRSMEGAAWRSVIVTPRGGGRVILRPR